MSMAVTKKKIALIGSVGLPASYGGFETLVDQLVRHLSNKFEFHVYCSGKRYKERASHHNGAKLHYVSLDANGASSILYDTISSIHAATYADVLIVLGVSGGVFLPLTRLLTRGRIIVNVDGVEWRRDKWGRFAKRFLRLSERIATRAAHKVVADNQEIANYIWSEYGQSSECIAYGGDHAVAVSIDEQLISRFPFLSEPYSVKVCRIEPENNVDMILEAFAQMHSRKLVVIGNWSASRYGVSLRSRFQEFKNLELLDPIYDQEMLNCIRQNAILYLHGHSAGGTNPSLVEAMSLGLPVLAYDVGYNRVTTMSKARYFSSARSIVQLLESVSDSEWKVVGKKMLQIAKDEYTWSIIAKKYSNLISDES